MNIVRIVTISNLVIRLRIDASVSLNHYEPGRCANLHDNCNVGAVNGA
jgi:hypothetical protein